MRSKQKKALIPRARAAQLHLQKVDPTLAKVIQTVGRPKIELDPERSVYDALATSIFFQQLHANAANAILKRVQSLCDHHDSFPDPKTFLQFTAEEYRSCGLSRSKFLALSDLAHRTMAGTLPTRRETETLSDEEIIEKLTVVRGVGPWTAQMFLIFTLGRPDVFPVLDYGVRLGFQRVYKKRILPTPKAFEKQGERWRPYRSFASWYLWRALELDAYRVKKK